MCLVSLVYFSVFPTKAYVPRLFAVKQMRSIATIRYEAISHLPVCLSVIHGLLASEPRYYAVKFDFTLLLKLNEVRVFAVRSI